MRVTSKGQVTIPQHIREAAGLLPDTEVEFTCDGDVVTITRASRPGRPGRGDALVARLRGRLQGGMSTDEIMKLTRDLDPDPDAVPPGSPSS